MIINNYDLAGFYNKSEVEFLGREIDFKFMTPEQLDNSIAESINLYNKLYPPSNPLMRKIVKGAMIASAVAFTGGAVLASYGVGMGTAMGTVFGAGSATAATGSTLASVQSVATAISGAGVVYKGVTGDDTADLTKAADFIASPTGGDALKTAALFALKRNELNIQDDNEEAQEALKIRIEKEQKRLEENLRKQAALKAEQQGKIVPKKGENILPILGVATPFIMMFMNKG